MNPFVPLMVASIVLLTAASVINYPANKGVSLFTACIGIAEAGILVQGFL